MTGTCTKFISLVSSYIAVWSEVQLLGFSGLFPEFGLGENWCPWILPEFGLGKNRKEKKKGMWNLQLILFVSALGNKRAYDFV